MNKKLLFAGEIIDTATLNPQQTIKTVEIKHEMKLSTPFIYTIKYYCTIDIESDDEYRLVVSNRDGTLCQYAMPYVPFREAKIILDADNADWDELWYPRFRNYIEALTIEDFIDKYRAAADRAGATSAKNISIKIEPNLTVLTLKF